MPRDAQRSYDIFDGREIVVVAIMDTITDTEVQSVRAGKAEDIEVVDPLDRRSDFVMFPYVDGGISDLALEPSCRGESKRDIVVNVEDVFEANNKEALVIGFDGHRAIGTFNVKSGRLCPERGIRDLGEILVRLCD